jgi:hypothetical protein
MPSKSNGDVALRINRLQRGRKAHERRFFAGFCRLFADNFASIRSFSSYDLNVQMTASGSTFQPRTNAGNPFLKSRSNPRQSSSIEVLSDAMEHRLHFLAIDTMPDYTGTAPMPAAGQSALWKNKAIYLKADQRVGPWSDVVSIPVAG